MSPHRDVSAVTRDESKDRAACGRRFISVRVLKSSNAEAVEHEKQMDACSAVQRWRRRCTIGIILSAMRNVKTSRSRVNVRSYGGK
jgi:hypothetical protein